MKRHPFAPQVIACYRLSWPQRARRAVAAFFRRLTNWRA